MSDTLDSLEARVAELERRLMELEDYHGIAPNEAMYRRLRAKPQTEWTSDEIAACMINQEAQLRRQRVSSPETR